VKEMNRKNLLIALTVGFFFSSLVFFLPDYSNAQPVFSQSQQSFSDGVLSYQGTLLNSQGSPITGLHNIVFRIYNSNSSNAPLWQENRIGENAVKIEDGLFDVLLGSLNPIPISVWENEDLFLGIQVDNDVEMDPREAINVVPAAEKAYVSELALSVPDGSITKEKIAVDVPLNTIQSGVYGCDLVTCPDWGLNTGSGGRDYNTWIAFPSPFSTKPMVIVNISMFDMWSGSNPRLSATASQITNEGFTLTFHTWADTLVYGASATWLAYGEN